MLDFQCFYLQEAMDCMQRYIKNLQNLQKEFGESLDPDKYPEVLQIGEAIETISKTII